MKKMLTIVSGALVLALVSFMPIPAQARSGSLTKSSVELRTAMRTLWTDHMVYTRTFIISSLGGLEDGKGG